MAATTGKVEAFGISNGPGTPTPTDTTYLVDYAYLLRDHDGSVCVVHDRHSEGLFGRVKWLELLSQVGFRPISIPFDHSELQPGSHEVFVGAKPNS